MTTQRDTTIVVVDGAKLRRRVEIGPRGGKKYIYQAVEASETWGYWYDSAKQAARESNSTDKPVL